MLVRKTWGDRIGDACEWEYEGERIGEAKETKSGTRVIGWSLGKDEEEQV